MCSCFPSFGVYADVMGLGERAIVFQLKALRRNSILYLLEFISYDR